MANLTLSDAFCIKRFIDGGFQSAKLKQEDEDSEICISLSYGRSNKILKFDKGSIEEAFKIYSFGGMSVSDFHKLVAQLMTTCSTSIENAIRG